MSRNFTASRANTAFNQDRILIVVIEMSQSTWLVTGLLPGVERQPLKKLESDPDRLFALIDRWRQECRASGREIERLVVAYEAGRDGFWLARWLSDRGVEAHVIYSSSVAVSRDRRRAKTGRLDGLCMAATPSIEDEDAKRPTRERENLVGERTRIINRKWRSPASC